MSVPNFRKIKILHKSQDTTARELMKPSTYLWEGKLALVTHPYLWWLVRSVFCTTCYIRWLCQCDYMLLRICKQGYIMTKDKASWNLALVRVSHFVLAWILHSIFVFLKFVESTETKKEKQNSTCANEGSHIVHIVCKCVPRTAILVLFYGLVGESLTLALCNADTEMVRLWIFALTFNHAHV